MDENNEKKIKFLSVKEFADAIGVHPQTVRMWDKDGTLKAHHRTPGGQRMYSDEQVRIYLSNGVINEDSEG